MKRALMFLFLAPSLVYAQGGRNFDAVQVETKPVQGNIYMLTGAGGNVTVQIGTDGVFAGDSIVFFHGSNVVSGGDVFAIVRYPVVDFDGGGRVPGMIAGLDRIITLSDPSKVKGRTYIIPGHGRLCDREDVIKYRDMSVIIRNRVQDMIKKNMTLKQVQAAKPTWDYEPLYGATSGLAATDIFMQDLYNSLTAKK